MDLVGRLDAVLGELARRAPSARNWADRGDPRRLVNLIESAAHEHGARVLFDEGARRELADAHSGAAQLWEAWLDAKVDEEARWRASAATARLSFGDRSISLVEVESEIAHRDPARREAALDAADRAWRDLLAAQTRWLRSPDAKPEPEPEPEPPSMSGGLVIPSADEIAMFGLASPAAPVVEPAVTTDAIQPELGLLMAWAELAKELAAALRVPLSNWSDWVRAARGVMADFTPRGGFTSGALPWLRPFVPLRRGERRAAFGGFSAQANLLCRLVQESSAHCAAMVSADAVREELEDPRPAPQQVRGLALAWLGLAWTAHWGGAGEDMAAAARAITPHGAPESRILQAQRIRWCEARPGETGLYVDGSAMAAELLRGVQANLRLLEEWDADWYRNPACTPDRVRAALRVEPDPEAVLAWLRGAAQL